MSRSAREFAERIASSSLSSLDMTLVIQRFVVVVVGVGVVVVASVSGGDTWVCVCAGAVYVPWRKVKSLRENVGCDYLFVYVCE